MNPKDFRDLQDPADLIDDAVTESVRFVCDRCKEDATDPTDTSVYQFTIEDLTNSSKCPNCGGPLRKLSRVSDDEDGSSDDSEFSEFDDEDFEDLDEDDDLGSRSKGINDEEDEE